MGIVRADGRVATRNYIGILTSVNCSATVARAIADHFRATSIRGAGRLSRTSTAWSRSRTAPAAAWTARARACTSCDARSPATRTHAELRRRAGGRPRLRGEPDQRAGSRTSSLQRRRDAARVQHPGHRRHAQDGRARHRAASRRCCRTPTSVQREPVPRRATSRSACSAAAPTATPASAPTRRSAPRSTCWSRTAAPRSFPRRPRSTAPSTC